MKITFEVEVPGVLAYPMLDTGDDPVLDLIRVVGNAIGYAKGAGVVDSAQFLIDGDVLHDLGDDG